MAGATVKPFIVLSSDGVQVSGPEILDEHSLPEDSSAEYDYDSDSDMKSDCQGTLSSAGCDYDAESDLEDNTQGPPSEGPVYDYEGGPGHSLFSFLPPVADAASLSVSPAPSLRQSLSNNDGSGEMMEPWSTELEHSTDPMEPQMKSAAVSLCSTPGFEAKNLYVILSLLTYFLKLNSSSIDAIYRCDIPYPPIFSTK